jgi:hypothetical protein
MNNWCIVGFTRIFLLGILIFKRLTAQRLYKSFGVKGLTRLVYENLSRGPHMLSHSNVVFEVLMS